MGHMKKMKVIKPKLDSNIKLITLTCDFYKYINEPVHSIGIEDLKSIETFLNGKKFLMGEKVCNEDASIFGVLCQVVFHDSGPLYCFTMSMMLLDFEFNFLTAPIHSFCYLNM
jgi:hypothetical protein